MEKANIKIKKPAKILGKDTRKLIKRPFIKLSFPASGNVIF